MSLQPGQSLAHYRIDRKLGEGGMGEVWAATDTRLHRPAAIKALPAAVAGDPERLARFTREATVLAALSHPNIAAVYGLEREGDVPYLAMELAEGEDLSERIARGPIPVDDATGIALQIAAALEEAHDKGIVHRDLKPANIKVTADGKVKVLDFGLAKAMSPGSEDPGLQPDGGPGLQARAGTPTMTSPAMTRMGIILGTAGYMSPEQARGKTVDRRADIWAFGVILFEMLTGERLFAGDTVADVIAAVVTRDPDWSRLPDDVPTATRRVLSRCLEKDPRKRLRDIGDAALDLTDRAGQVAEAPAGRPTPPAAWRSGRVWLMGAAGLVLGLAGAFVLRGLSPTASPTTTWSNLGAVEGSPYDFTRFLEISPDGRRVVFVAPAPKGGEPLLWVRDLAVEAPRALADTEGAAQPFWSPDSRSIGYFAKGKLRRVSADGGASTALADAGTAPRGGCWDADGTILFVPDWSRPVFRIPASGGTPEAVTELDASRFDMSHRWPSFLPDGRHFLFYLVSTYPQTNPENPSPLDKSGLYIGSLDGSDAPRLLQTVRSRAVYVDGLLIFVDNNVLTARPFDLDTLSFSGDGMAIARGVTQTVDALWGGALFSVSDTGSLLFVHGAREHEMLFTLQWRDRKGNDLGTVGEPQPFTSVRLSHDGRRLAASRGDPGDIWLYDLQRRTSTRFTFDPGNDELPMWSPHDDQIMFQSNRVIPGKPFSPANLFEKTASGLEPEQYAGTTAGVMSFGPDDWSPDGTLVTLWAMVPGKGSEVLLYSTADHTFRPYLSNGDGELSSRFSPDGHWLAYTSQESGHSEVYVQAFPGPGGKWQVSTGGGTLPVWRADGKELYYAGPDALMAVAVDTRNGFRYEAPAKLFAFDAGLTSAGYYGYDVAPDGSRFLVLTPVEDPAAQQATVTLVQGWRALLEPASAPR